MNLSRAVGVLALILLAAAGWSAEQPTLNDNRIRLHIKASDPEGGKLTFQWIQLEGPEARILDATNTIYDDNSKKWRSDTYFIPTKAGVYTFQVTVKNEAGLETKKTIILEAKKTASE